MSVAVIVLLVLLGLSVAVIVLLVLYWDQHVCCCYSAVSAVLGSACLLLF